MPTVRRRNKKPNKAVEPAKIEQVDDDNEVAENVDDVKRIIDKYVAKVDGPLSAIRAMCVHCMGAQIKAISNCPSVLPPSVDQSENPCPLWPFRMGKNTMDPRYGVYKAFPSKKKSARKTSSKRRAR